MRVGWVCCARRVARHNVKVPRRLLSTQAQPHSDALSKATRNIGIIAHIDAVSDEMNSSFGGILIKAGQNYHYGAHALLQWAYQKNWKYVNLHVLILIHSLQDKTLAFF
jgi:hypothetical protein